MTNLLENTNKIQAVARTKQKRNQLADLRPEWTGQAETTILGITLTLERRRNSETETKRIDNARRRTKLLACLPLPWPNKLAVYKALFLPAVVYGWVCRKMPADDADHLHKALTRALRTNVMANSDIRKVVYGGTTHPLCVIKQRLFRRLGRLKKQKSVTWTNRAWTSTNLLRNYLADDNWTEVREWCWTNTSCTSLTLDAAENKTCHDPECHLLRQQWRLQCLQDAPDAPYWFQLGTSSPWNSFRSPPCGFVRKCSLASLAVAQSRRLKWMSLVQRILRNTTSPFLGLSLTPWRNHQTNKLSSSPLQLAGAQCARRWILENSQPHGQCGQSAVAGSLWRRPCCADRHWQLRYLCSVLDGMQCGGASTSLCIRASSTITTLFF